MAAQIIHLVVYIAVIYKNKIKQEKNSNLSFMLININVINIKGHFVIKIEI